MHIYAFGSVCRGEIDTVSDIDLLALVDGFDKRFDPAKYSIYSYAKMRSLWSRGSPFALHLSIESRLLFASDGQDFLSALGEPQRYRAYVADCEKFLDAFKQAQQSLRDGASSRVFDLSTAFLSIRNISTCYALGVLGQPNFSRHAAIQLPNSPFPSDAYRIMERARILATRAAGDDITEPEAGLVLDDLPKITSWMEGIVNEAREYERIQQSG